MSDAPTSAPPPPAPRRRAGRWWARALGWTLSGLVAVLLAALAFGWWWSGTPQSLAQALALASRHMPDGQTLAAQNVEGSLRGGGRIGSLQWNSPGLRVDVRDLELRWRLRPLLERRLEVAVLHAGELRLTPGTPSEAPPGEPLTSVELPIDIDLPFAIGTIVWADDPATTVRGLAGHYRYAQGRHDLRLDGVEVADGRYEGTLTLQGAAPMALQAALRGRIAAPMAERTAPLVVLAQADVQGTLAQPDGRLSVQARVTPEPGHAADQGMRATLQAEIAPWATQPVHSAQAAFAQIDAARFWPGAPRTLLSGELQAGPRTPAAADGATLWQAQLALRNAEPGPWDKGQLPVARIDARVEQDGPQWVVPTGSIEAGQGRIELQGRYSPAPTPWQIDARVQGVRPDLLYTGLDAAPVSGQVQAAQQGDAIRFDVGLKAAPAPGRPAGALLGGLRIDEVLAPGLWQAPTLDLRTLRVVAGPARVTGRARVQTEALAGNGQIDLDVPGASLRLEGDMAPQRGTAQARVDLRDAAALQRWVASLPGQANIFAGASASGAARLDLRWDGGWKLAQQQLARPGVAQAGIALRAALDAPRLDLSLPPSATAPAGAPPSRVLLRGVQASLAGSPADATLALDGMATHGPQQVQLHLRAGGGITGPDQWRLALSALRAQWKPDTASEALPWTAQLQGPLTADLRRPTGTADWDVQASAASLALQGPAPGTVRLEWQPLTVASAPPDHRNGLGLRLRSRGRLVGLPLAWAEALGANLQAARQAGVGGDIVFDGEWDIDAMEQLRVSARIARASGDLLVRSGDAALVRSIRTTGTGTASETRFDGAPRTEAPSTPAGVRRAELSVSADDAALRVRLDWDSTRAGRAEADLRSRLARAGGAWTWPQDAPLEGRVTAQLPDIGAWTMFAPPAWRIDGSLAADAALAGTRTAPRWNGTLSGEGLAVRAAVEGIELRNGRLRARLQGNELTLQEFSLQGGQAGTARIAGPSGNLSTIASERAQDGGELRVTGTVRWDPVATGSSGIQMDMQTQLRRLRLLVRSDRQVALSGNLQTSLREGQIQVRGDIKADRGVIILPDESAPTLGTDVKVRSAAIDAELAAAQARAQKAADAAAAKAAAPVPSRPPDIAVGVDMGNDFAVQGHGLTTRLAGRIEVRANAASNGEPRITGEIRTVAGRYRAYGQQLDVESGLARFNGPYANPSLDILAVRPNLEQKAGVQITGSAQAPRVALYSRPQLSDAETLSWMLLGRSTAGGGAEAALMQQAALALLGGFGPKGGGGNFASRLGLDEIGFRGPSAGEDTSGSAITLGKRLTDQIYVTYEASLAGTLGTLYVFYDLTRNLALRGQAGLQSGVDLIYTLSFD